SLVLELAAKFAHAGVGHALAQRFEASLHAFDGQILDRDDRVAGHQIPRHLGHQVFPSVSNLSVEFADTDAVVDKALRSFEAEALRWRLRWIEPCSSHGCPKLPRLCSLVAP